MNLVGRDNPILRWLAAAAIVTVLVIVALSLVDGAMRTRAIADEKFAARDEATILANSLTSELDKFSLLPLALAQDPQVGALVAGDRSAARALDRRLEALAAQSQAAAIYVMDRSGTTLSASNWNRPTSFVGSNYAFRDYYRDALRDGTATQFALGTVSRKPGLYVAARIGSADQPGGIVAVKVEFDALEESWREATRGVYVTDAESLVLLSSDPDWRFHLATFNNAGDREQQGASRSGQTDLPSLERELAGLHEEVVRVSLPQSGRAISPAGWDLHLILDPAPRVAAALASGRLALLLGVALLGALVFVGLFVRRRRLAHEEAIVAERTSTLREQLLQANRLATLGQISAGVNHQIGQPVAALRVFAESGEKLAAAGRAKDAEANFREIVGLADRIDKITGELRQFSRRQPGEPRVVAIGEIIDGALLLLRDRIVSRSGPLGLPDDDLVAVTVSAEHVRLEQVLVNLLQNALDATGPDDAIAIDIALEESRLRLSVTDHGAGIPDGDQSRLFQPFATSKADGLGLGLVIARDIMRDLGGDLVYEPHEGGTRFTMIVPRAIR